MKHKFPGKDELESCIRCNCAEGTLPTDCPGYEISWEIQEAIWNGSLDFRDGEWQEKKWCIFRDGYSNDPEHWYLPVELRTPNEQIRVADFLELGI